MSTTVRDVMTTPVVTVRQDTPFKQVVVRVRAARVGAVPVIDGSGLVLGIVCEHDLLARKAGLERAPGLLARARHQGRHQGRHRGERGRAAANTAGDTAGDTAASLMAGPAVTIRGEARTAEAARLMYRHRIASLPVVDSLGRLIGLISQGDVLDGFIRQDAEIRREVVRDVIARELLLDPHAFTVAVRDGIVTLSGQPESEQVGELLAAAVRRVDGVVGLRDQMHYPVGKTAWTVLPPQQPWLSRVAQALALPFR